MPTPTSDDRSAQFGVKFWLTFVVCIATGLALGYALISQIEVGAKRQRPGDAFVETDMSKYIDQIGEGPAVVVARSDCHVCQTAKTWARENKLALRFVEISDSPAAQEAVRTLGFQGVPVLLTREGAIQGFDAAAWTKALKRP